MTQLLVSTDKYIVIQNGHRGATASASFIETEELGKLWYVNRVLVPEHMRGQGVGTQMVQKLIEEVKKRNGKRLIVEPGGYNSDPERQRNFYIRLGFKLMNEHPNAYEYIID